MTATRMISLTLVLTMAPFFFGCAGLGVTRTGKQFNYENVSKLKEGQTKAEVTTLLEGEPTRTGRQAHTGYDEMNYSYSEAAGASAWMRYIPFLSYLSLGKTVVTQFTCNVRFDNDLLVNFDYDKIETGSESAGI